MNTIKKCFDKILTGDRAESRLAARRVTKLIYSSTTEGKERYDEIKKIINLAPHEYDGIAEDWRQENFVIAVSVIYFLHDREKQPDFLFPWLFQLLQHQNGSIRHAAVKMIAHEIGPLTLHIRFPGEKSYTRELKPKQADNILRSLYASLNGLLPALWEAKYIRYKYIDSLPPSPYKSVQMVLAELEDSCGEKYMDRLNTDGAVHSNMEIETKKQILQKRREIERELLDMLRETESDFDLEDVKDVIYNEEESDDMMKAVAMFDGSTALTTGRGGNASELSNILELVTDAWNYFPHRSLNGRSPMDTVYEHRK